MQSEVYVDSQLKKGLLDACILAHLYDGDSYGYVMLRDVSYVVPISESTLYPILRRLEKANCLTTYSREFDGRLRKYYSITPEGRARLVSFRREWGEMAKVYNYVIGRTGL